jgi:hypothetical protein
MHTWSNTLPLFADLVAYEHSSGAHLANPVEKFRIEVIGILSSK